MKRFLCLLALMITAHSSWGETKTIALSNLGDENGKYALSMIKLALSYSNQNYIYNERTENFTQQRNIEELNAGNISVMWAATNTEIESQVLPIRIPLYKGLLGHRIFLIREGDQARFDRINTLDELKTIPIGQGKGWADTEILKANGFKVIAPVKFDSLMYMLDGERFDAFPRGVFEPFKEVGKFSKAHLAVEKKFMLVYKMPYYLFVSPNNKALAAELEKGLKAAIADGSFNKLFMSNPNVQEAIEKADMAHRKVFYLDNPQLPRQTPVDVPEYWVDIKTFGKE